MRRVAFFTSTRAEYGLLRPIMAEIGSRPCMELELIVSGTHLSKAHGETWQEIASDGFSIDASIDIFQGEDSAHNAAALTLNGVANALVHLAPDLLVLLGDRYELLAAAQAAILTKVPIAHIHGGETTEGAIDDNIRHAITKLAYWHFPAAEVYAERIRQMGEIPAHVWNVGAPAMDNIAALNVIPLADLETFLGLSLQSPSFLVTYHPVTNENDNGILGVRSLLTALNEFSGSIIITGVNADPGASLISSELDEFALKSPGRVVLIESLGAERYLSLMHYVDAVVGNSSSGIIEAPAVGVSSVNIGSRQKGRLLAPSVISCGESVDDIRNALMKALTPYQIEISSRRATAYGKPGCARRIADILQTVELGTLNKPFVDLRTVIR